MLAGTAQTEVDRLSLMESPFGCVLQMPTGSGKTWLSVKAMRHAISSGRRAIYLCPIRALANELFERWSAEHPELGPIGVFTGDFGKAGAPYPVPFERARLLIMTPERLDACTRHWRAHWSWIPEVDVVVADELHLLGDGLRGARLEGALMRLRRLNPFARVIGLSATLGNRTELANWLDATEFESAQRPVPLSWRIATFRRADEKPSILLEEASRITRVGGKTIVFTQSRRRAESLAQHLRAHGLRAIHHHAGLDRESRRRVEVQFRVGDANVLVATATLEVGMNLPARQVVLYDLQNFNGQDFVPLSVSTVWQRVGRAGRPGLDIQGEAVLIAPRWDASCRRYERGQFESVLSALSSPAAISDQVLAEVGSGLSRTRSQLAHAFRDSLAHRQNRLPDLIRVVDQMCSAGMLIEDGADGADKVRLKATRLGRIATRHMLSPASILAYKHAHAQGLDLTYFDWLIVSCSTEDCEPVLPVDFESLDTLTRHVHKEQSRLLSMPASVLAELLQISRKRLLAAIKMAAAIRAWTRSGTLETVAEEFDCYPFEIRRLSESLVRLLSAGAATVSSKTPLVSAEAQSEFAAQEAMSEIPDAEERLATLGKMVEAGLDEDVISLTLVDGIGAKWAAKLHANGCHDLEDLAQADAETLVGLGGLSKERALTWIALAEQRLSADGAHRYRELGGITEAGRLNWPDGIDPYRLRRAQQLRVERLSPRTYRISGGLDPHIVGYQNSLLSCDCSDAANGRQCKHLLAVRLENKDASLRDCLKRLETLDEQPVSELHALWMAN